MTSRQPVATQSVRPHLLIVTDDPELRDFLTESLVYGGFWISVIASGLQVLEVFRLRSFDLALIDEAIPGLDAVELVRRLRAPADESDAARTDIPILLIVDQPDVARDAVARRAGVDGVLAPPIAIETLVPDLFGRITSWRAAHPDRPWADQAAAMPIAGQPETRTTR